MNIRCTQIEGSLDQLVHQLNDRRLTGQIFQVLDKFLVVNVGLGCLLKVALLLGEIHLQGLLDILRTCQRHGDRLAGT